MKKICKLARTEVRMRRTGSLATRGVSIDLGAASDEVARVTSCLAAFQRDFFPVTSRFMTEKNASGFSQSQLAITRYSVMFLDQHFWSSPSGVARNRAVNKEPLTINTRRSSRIPIPKSNGDGVF